MRNKPITLGNKASPQKVYGCGNRNAKKKYPCVHIHSFIQQIPISTEFLEHSKRTMWLRQPFHSHSLFRQKIQPVMDASCYYRHTISNLSLQNKATLTFLNRRWLYTLTFVFTEQTKIAYYIWGICTNTINTATSSSKSWRKMPNTTANIEISLNFRRELTKCTV